MVTVVAVSVSSLFVAMVAISEGPLGRDGRTLSWNRVSEEGINLFNKINDTAYSCVCLRMGWGADGRGNGSGRRRDRDGWQ